MRIALLTYSTKPRGGVVHTLSLAEALVRQGMDVSVFSVQRNGETAFFRDVDSAIKVHLAPFEELEGESIGKKVERSIASLSQTLGQEKFDIVHAQDCISANAARRCVRTVHHLDQFKTPQLVRCHEDALTNPVAHICVSRAVAAQLKQGWGIDAKVVPNGVDFERFQSFAIEPQDWQMRMIESWHSVIGGPYVLTVGGIEPRKGTMDLLRIMEQIRPKYLDLRLVIAGGASLFDYGEYREEFHRLANRLNVEPIVLGTVEHAKLPALVAGAKAFIFPSINEGFGLAALEASAARVPLILRELPVFKEFFGDAAIFGSDAISMADALLRTLADADSNRLDNGVELARSFSWDSAAISHMSLYEQWLPLFR